MRHPMFAAVTAALIALAQPAMAQDLASQLIGVWRWHDHVLKDVATGKVSRPYGEKPTGIITYTKGGNVVFAVFGDSRKAAAGPLATDAERAALFSTMAAATGTYKVDGNTLMTTYQSAWNQSWTGTTQKRQIEISGNRLTLTSAPFKNMDTGQDSIFVVTFERAE